MTQTTNGTGAIGCAKDQTTQLEEQSENSLDKVREIIFGGQMRDYENRFASLEGDFQRRTSLLQKDFEKRLSDLDEFVKRELEVVHANASLIKTESAESLSNLSNNVADLGAKLEQNIAELDASLSLQTADLRNDVARDHASILDESKALVKTLTDTVNRETQTLQNTKTDRLELASLFSEFATRFDSEFNPQGS